MTVPKRVRTSVYLTQDFYDEVKAFSEDRHWTLNTTIREALKMYLQAQTNTRNHEKKE